MYASLVYTIYVDLSGDDRVSVARMWEGQMSGMEIMLGFQALQAFHKKLIVLPPPTFMLHKQTLDGDGSGHGDDWVDMFFTCMTLSRSQVMIQETQKMQNSEN